jgi:hypothetical protein
MIRTYVRSVKLANLRACTYPRAVAEEPKPSVEPEDSELAADERRAALLRSLAERDFSSLAGAKLRELRDYTKS